MLDDDTTYNLIGVKSSYSPNGANSAMVKKLTLVNPKFKVYYTDNLAPRTIDFNEFQSNVLYKTGGTLDQDFIDGLFVYKQAVGYNNTYITYDDDTYNFNFRMMYVPINFGAAGYNGFVDVTLPVFEFTSLDNAKQKYDYAETIAKWQSSPLVLKSGSGTSDEEKLFALINYHWKLTAQYRRGSISKTGDIAFTPAMFNEARTPQPANYGVALWGDGTMSGLISNYKANAPGIVAGMASGWFRGGLSSGQGLYMEERDWPLPLTYRGETKSDADETVKVILQAVGPFGQSGGGPIVPW